MPSPARPRPAPHYAAPPCRRAQTHATSAAPRALACTQVKGEMGWQSCMRTCGRCPIRRTPPPRHLHLPAITWTRVPWRPSLPPWLPSLPPWHLHHPSPAPSYMIYSMEPTRFPTRSPTGANAATAPHCTALHRTAPHRMHTRSHANSCTHPLALCPTVPGAVKRAEHQVTDNEASHPNSSAPHAHANRQSDCATQPNPNPPPLSVAHCRANRAPNEPTFERTNRTPDHADA